MRRRAFILAAAAGLTVPPAVFADGSNATIPAAETEAIQPSVWQSDLKLAWRMAHAQQKPIFLFLTSDGCIFCRKMESSTLKDERIVADLTRAFVPASVSRLQAPRLTRRLGIRLYPTSVIIGLDGRVADTIHGFVTVEELQARLKRLNQTMASTGTPPIR